MSQNELNLCPCRNCGSFPDFSYYAATCPVCLEEVYWREAANHQIAYQQEYLKRFIIKYWNARNEKHNPFMEDQNEEKI